MGSTKINGAPINDYNGRQSAPGNTTISFDKSTGEVKTERKEIILAQNVLIDENGNTKVVENQLKLEEGLKEREKIKEYNDNLYENRDTVVDEMALMGPRVMIRLLKLQKYNKQGMYVGGRSQEVISESKMKKNIVQLPDSLQFQERGVVVKIGLGCSEFFKTVVKPGDIVDLEPNAILSGRSQRYLHKEMVGVPFENYFITTEHTIESIISKD